ncbi:hypothetical protein SUNI508_12538 [Seiridium unicorne]|uniref:Uncharacterized protein n=1 Tax=Seiridium unicorne TaxID=138068 RepID=A0ABR2VH13_9PEZI
MAYEILIPLFWKPRLAQWQVMHVLEGQKNGNTHSVGALQCPADGVPVPLERHSPNHVPVQMQTRRTVSHTLPGLTHRSSELPQIAAYVLPRRKRNERTTDWIYSTAFVTVNKTTPMI